jgi:hypothetical protein
MEFYYFGGNFDGNQISRLENSCFSGVMFTYDSTQGDMFVRVAKDIKLNEKIKYLIAIRPYSISPQYLCMINQSMNEVDSSRLQINLISGYIKEHELDFGGILGSVNDTSSRAERSNYMIDYVNTLNTMPGNSDKANSLDFYVSTTNEYMFNVVKQNNNKIILPYRDYKNGAWTIINSNGGQSLSDVSFDLSGMNVMLALTPIIRKTQQELDSLIGYGLRPVWKKREKPAEVTDIGYFTYQEFYEFVDELEKSGINQLLINGWPEDEREIIINFIKEYSELKGYKNNPSLENNLGE